MNCLQVYRYILQHLSFQHYATFLFNTTSVKSPRLLPSVFGEPLAGQEQYQVKNAASANLALEARMTLAHSLHIQH
jgi:hypothetical protein